MIAAVSGYAVAGGLELSLLADLRVVEQCAIFGVFCRRFGMFPDKISTDIGEARFKKNPKKQPFELLSHCLHVQNLYLYM